MVTFLPFRAYNIDNKLIIDTPSETDTHKQATKMQHFDKMLSDIVMPDLETSETESFFVSVNY